MALKSVKRKSVPSVKKVDKSKKEIDSEPKIPESEVDFLKNIQNEDEDSSDSDREDFDSDDDEALVYESDMESGDDDEEENNEVDDEEEEEDDDDNSDEEEIDNEISNESASDIESDLVSGEEDEEDNDEDDEESELSNESESDIGSDPFSNEEENDDDDEEDSEDEEENGISNKSESDVGSDPVEEDNNSNEKKNEVLNDSKSGTEGHKEIQNIDKTNYVQIKKKKKKEKSKKILKPSAYELLKKEDENSAVNKLLKEIRIENGLKNQVDEYAEDTSDEEDIRNTVGNIPMHWYDDYKHIGYDWDAKQIIKPVKRDQLDNFLKRMEDPDFWRTVTDPQTGQDVVLSEADIQLIKRINSQKLPDQHFDEYGPWIEWFSSKVETFPISNVPEHKRSFLPSRTEKKRIGKLVHSIKMGFLKSKEEEDKLKAKKHEPKFYMLWQSDREREKMRRIHDHVSAPKRDLPGHAESYNPPKEYLFNEQEMKEWQKMETTPYKRKLHFLPQKYNSLREVPSYSRYLRERFLRCLDLYLCPRGKRMKLTIGAEYLVPKLPSPRDLQPFPTVESLIYKGHTDIIRTISIEPKGEYIVTGSDDTTIKIWEICTTRCIKTIRTGDVVRSVAWCPNSKLLLIVVATGNRLLIINPRVGDKLLIKKTDELLEEAPMIDGLESERLKAAVQWNMPTPEEFQSGIRIIINHFKEVKQVTWHGKGDYFATVMPEGAHRSVIIHQISKRKSQIPFSKSKGLTQCVLFHPVKPCLFVATQRNIRIYDLVKQEIVKKLLSNSKWISSMSIHPKGDNLIVGTYDKKMLWFDLDLSTKPYQTIRLHTNAIRSVAFHQRYPLFASSSDDRSVIVSHGMVYNDLLQNPLIVPLKKLVTHERSNDFGVFEVIWHPTQPWVFSCGADSTIRLYT